MDGKDEFYRKLGDRIRAKRQECGLSQEGLASAVGLKRPSLSNIEKGRQNLLLHTFCDIAATLNASVSELLPEHRAPAGSGVPDLRGLPERVREFVEAGIKRSYKSKLSHKSER
jgi:transcriptional regulator with XRE-family HTH domain